MDLFKSEFKRKKKEQNEQNEQSAQKVPGSKKESKAKINLLEEISPRSPSTIVSFESINYKYLTQFKLFLNCKKIYNNEIFDPKIILDLKRSPGDLFKSFFLNSDLDIESKKIKFNDIFIYKELTLYFYYPDIKIAYIMYKNIEFQEKIKNLNLKFFRFFNYDKVFAFESLNNFCKFKNNDPLCFLCSFGTIKDNQFFCSLN